MIDCKTIHKHKRILVGITGGIAAYKSPDLVRRLIERGAEVRVVMTDAAIKFIAPLTLQAVSGHPVFQHSVFEHVPDAEAESGMGHIELARWAELIVVAPATANFMAKVAHGEADDLLSTLVLASEADLVIAPAMNQQMWQNQATRENIEVLQGRGVTIIGPGEGDQACGETGPGRMIEPEDIAQQLLGDGIPQLLAGKAVLVTAGPTWEAIDPVRGITNRSSGKMGFAVADAAKDFGATVTVVCGPVSICAPVGIEKIDVQSAQQMQDAVMSQIGSCDIFIGVAAVADYRPVEVAAQKIKKDNDEMVITLVKTPDILSAVARSKPKPFTVGFAAETENLIENSQKKLKAKNVDMIVANDVSGQQSAFGNDSNAVNIIHKQGEVILERTDKYRLAIQIIEHICKQYLKKQNEIKNRCKNP
ncbi:bifunctional phosphopantothenoylcysteine decarboxylase/phosphopantothenate--cysteine ligase CoaBC [Candidatus Spongiihabitans sp.]|uniref:bifunctional phosphopantothenoylcysteine decarboxylase/phosphopantothenate--cysteine ligase CoaBC n=1 Tax=Candidatus Spongiihabitans sp. TaxID=3101308 RepID=UPI003C6FF964